MRALLWLLALLLLTACANESGIAQPAQGAAGHPAAPASPAAELPNMRCLFYERELFLSAMASPREYSVVGSLKAGMIPHHLVASDMIAGFMRLAAEEQGGYDAVLIISPSHFPENCGRDIVTALAGWETPFGNVACDEALTRALLNAPGFSAEDNPAAMEADHGVAGLVPFVRYYLPGAKVAGCLLSNRLSRSELAVFRETVAKLCESGRVLLIASVDCSHYLSPEEAALRDGETARAIEAMDFERILSFGDGNVDSPQAVTTFLEAVRNSGLSLVQMDTGSSAERLPYSDSNPIYRDGVTTYQVYAACETEHEQAVVLAAAGDIMVHDAQLRVAYNSGTGQYDFLGAFAKIADEISSADFAVANLETVLAGEESGYGESQNHESAPRFNAPDSLATALAGAGFDLLSTANNHCMDRGEAGLLRTVKALDEAGLHHTGTFATPSASARPELHEVNGVRVAFAAFTYGTNGIPVPRDKPWMVNMLDERTVAGNMRAAKAQSPDWIVALPHMGAEYANATSDEFRLLADTLIAHGADIVLASHPHVLQPVELRRVHTAGGERKGLVAWSLGNFISSQREPPRETGMILKLRLTKEKNLRAVFESAEIIPTWVQLRDADGRAVARVLPIVDAIADYEGENRLRLLERDYLRIQEAYAEVDAMFS